MRIMTLEFCYLSSRRHIPDSNLGRIFHRVGVRKGTPGRSHHSAARGKGNCGNGMSVSLEIEHFLAGQRLPYADAAIEATGSEKPPVRGARHVRDFMFVPGQDRSLGSRLQVTVMHFPSVAADKCSPGIR